MRPFQFFSALLAMSSMSVALSDVLDNIRDISGAKDILIGRQDNQNQDQQSQAPSKTVAPNSSSQPSQTQDKDNKDNASSGTAKASGSQGGSKSGSGQSKPTSFDPRLPAGGIAMVTPAAIAGEQYYKVGDWITFAWNYTSLSVTPSFVDVMASCTANQATYTIAVNQSASETTVLWNTKDTPSGQPPFLTEKYTLIIYDAESSISAAPQPGYLGVFNQLTFGMYTPQPRVDWADFQCANCVKNGALSQHEKMTIKVMLFTSATTIASLLYFAHNFGVW